MEKNYFYAQSYSDALNDYVYFCNNNNEKAEEWEWWIFFTTVNK